MATHPAAPASGPLEARGRLVRLRSGWALLLVAVLAVFAVAPLTYPGFFQAESGFLPVYNVQHISDAPHWGRVSATAQVTSQPSASYGQSPLWFEGKLPYLLAWPFFRLSGSGVVAIRWAYGLAFLLGALAAYAWTRRWFGLEGGVLAALVYTYLPWHLCTVFARGAYAEAWLWALVPVAFWAVDRLKSPRTLSAVVVGLVAQAAAFWVQAGLASLLLLLAALYAAATLPRRRRLLLTLAVAGALFAALALAARLAFVEAPAVPGDFLYPFQLLSAAWSGGTPYQLGVAAVGLSLVAAGLWVGGRREAASGRTGAVDARQQVPDARPTLGPAFVFWLVALLATLFLTLRPSAFVWRITGLSALVAHPWQLLILAAPSLCFLAGSVTRLDRRLASLPSWSGLAALTVLASYAYLDVRFTRFVPSAEPAAVFEPVGARAPGILLLDAEVAPGSEVTPTLTLTLTWQAVAPVPDDYTVFVHLLAPDGSKVAQQDSRPCGGQCPTGAWQPGEIVVDSHELALPADAAGPYRLATGLYLLDTGERAAVVGREDGTVYLDVP